VLNISAGHWSLTGPREHNDDFVGLVEPMANERDRKGVIAVIADGVAGPYAREAAEHCARNILADYYATPDTWPVIQALDKLYQGVNRWVLSQANTSSARAGMATTLTTLVLRGETYHFAHVGDTRLYVLRSNADTLQRLTTDHVWNRPEMDHVLTRAIGLDPKMTTDFGMGTFAVGDVFALVSDGAWAKLAERDLRALLAAAAVPTANLETSARSIVETALRLGGQDNTSALVLRVDALGEEALSNAIEADQHLPPLPMLTLGSTFDDLRIQSVLHRSRATVLYRVQRGGRDLVLKTLAPEVADDAHERLALSHEMWLAQRLNARFFAEAVPSISSPSGLYFLSTYYEGRTLAQAVKADHHFTLPEALRVAMDLTRALGALHRRSVIHRDIKPDNVHLGSDGQLRLLDLGTALSGVDFHGLARAPRTGTPSFLAPELFADGEAGVRTDLYAWGVTVYWMLTRKFPYGEIEPFQTPRFTAPVPPSRTRPDIPGWFENILLRVLSIAPQDRYETAEELLLALEHGPVSASPPPKPRPLLTRNTLRAWQLIAAALAVGNLVLLYVLFGRA
jgi:serine/threonine protein phosphatase PrpC